MAMLTNQDWYLRWQAVIELVERVETDTELDALLDRLSKPEKATVLAFVNAHAMNSITASSRFFEAIRAADVVVRDGSGMATLYKMLSLSPGLNLNGTDLIPQLIRRFGGRKIALFGTQEPYLKKAEEQIRRQLTSGSVIVSTHGFHDAQTYVRLAIEQCPSLIVLGMGMPKQEEVAQLLRSALDHPCLIVCGGAIIDFLGGKTSRAPKWMRSSGIEWFFRLVLEPRRLFRRYVIGNPLFLLRSFRFAANRSS